MSRQRDPAPKPDPRLDRYRAAVAAAYDEHELVGRLSTSVDMWWTTEGPWWRRHDVRPTERVAWMLTFARNWPHAHPDGWDDGIDATVEELDRDTFPYRGRVLTLRWLSPEAAEAHLAAHRE